jgi:hypothetical protein
LIVEDFGTTGLTGPLEPKDRKAKEEHESDHRLFWFFKNVGRTSKTGEQLGSFGIGKTVFPYSSPIRTFFGYSVRRASRDEPTAVLLGQSHLREHRIDDRHDLDPIGFFAWHEGLGADYEQRAITELPLLEDFRVSFGITRSQNECGLSVVIPYADNDLTPTSIAKSVIDQFFVPILSGQLSVDIRHGAGTVSISSAETLLAAIERFKAADADADTLRRRVMLAQWALGEGQRTILEIGRPARISQPKFDETMIGKERLVGLSQRFLAGDRLAIRVPVPVEPKRQEVVLSHVDIFLEYDRALGSSDEVYAREGLTLIDHHGLARCAGLRSIMLARDRPVARMLRSSENVAHTKWRQRGAALLSQQYDRGSYKVGYVLGLVDGIVHALLSPEDSSDWWTLSDLFPAPADPSPLPNQAVAPADAGLPRGPIDDRSPTQEEESEVPAIPPPTTRQWRARPIPRGIRIEGNAGFEGHLRPIRFRAGYALLNGRGFRNHDPVDFSFETNPNMITAESAKVQTLGPNLIEIQPIDMSFRVEITGFDRHRAFDYRISVVERD